MDKNLINIDDLVRQRLGGGEEQEQSGSWIRMRELLDKEMPQRPAGMYWRRMFSAVAVLLLIAAISLGGYELSFFKKGTIGSNNNVPIAAVTDARSANAPADNTSKVIAATKQSEPASDDESKTGSITGSKEIANTQKQNHKHLVSKNITTTAPTHNKNVEKNAAVTNKTSEAIAANKHDLGKMETAEKKEEKNTLEEQPIAANTKMATVTSDNNTPTEKLIAGSSEDRSINSKENTATSVATTKNSVATGSSHLRESNSKPVAGHKPATHKKVAVIRTSSTSKDAMALASVDDLKKHDKHSKIDIGKKATEPDALKQEPGLTSNTNVEDKKNSLPENKIESNTPAGNTQPLGQADNKEGINNIPATTPGASDKKAIDNNPSEIGDSHNDLKVLSAAPSNTNEQNKAVAVKKSTTKTTGNKKSGRSSSLVTTNKTTTDIAANTPGKDHKTANADQHSHKTVSTARTKKTGTNTPSDIVGDNTTGKVVAANAPDKNSKSTTTKKLTTSTAGTQDHEKQIAGATPAKTTNDEKVLASNVSGNTGKSVAAKRLSNKKAITKKSELNIAGNTPAEDANNNPDKDKVLESDVPGNTSKSVAAKRLNNKKAITKKSEQDIAGNTQSEKADINSDDEKVPAANTTARHTKAVAAKKLNNKAGVQKSTQNIAGNTPSEAVDKNSNDDKMLASNTSGNHSKTVAVKKLGNKTKGAPKTAQSIAGNTPSEAADNESDDDNTLTSSVQGKSNRTAAPKKLANPVAAKQPGKKTASKLASNTPIVPAAGIANNTSGKSTVSRTSKKGQRMVEKLTVTEHYIKTSLTDGYYHLDTISREVVSEEYDLASNNFPAMIAFGPQLNEIPAANTKSVNESSANADEANETAHVRKNKGTNSLESLHAAFNDVKNKFTGTHFTPGITAGINGNFFGPNTFKGFQFGMNCAVVFNDKVSVMADLKYFQRVNNSFTIADDYYSYTPGVSGGYTKELVRNPYSFSALHNIEMPLYVRYTTGNFNFFTGCNFEYSFAINTGAYPLTDPATATQVTTIENDNTPKLKAEDFNSRFGVGYLVGASYQLSPKVALDFRSVQTVWDNGKTNGAKIISNQLYKSPSLQLSLGYTLGGNKGKDKE